jgi:ketosteroid isomerase-like protein
MTEQSDVLAADRALVSALANGDAQAALAWLDDDFVWVEIDGRALSKTEAAFAVPAPPHGDEAGLTPAVHRYGDVAHVSVGRDEVFVLRIWVRRDGGWRLLSYHAVSQNLPAAPHGPGRKDWDNPCRTLPYEPRTVDERDCLTAWQQLETAVVAGDAEVWAQHIADEFMVLGPTRRHSKADRKAVLAEQKRSGTQSAPAPLVSARLFGFGDAMVMLCEHQPFHGKAARVSRVFVKRNGHWLMAVSFQTTRQDAPVKTI